MEARVGGERGIILRVVSLIIARVASLEGCRSVVREVGGRLRGKGYMKGRNSHSDNST